MTTIGWATDLHLDKAEIDRCLDQIQAADLDVLLLGGDLCDGPLAWPEYARLLRDATDARIYTVIGHTHHPGKWQPLENLTSFCAQATYGRPRLQSWTRSV